MVDRKSVRLGLLAPLCLMIIGGCGAVATRTKFHEPITADLLSRDYAAAARLIEKAKKDGKYGQKERLLYYLDSGLIYHYADLPDSSNNQLEQAESAAEELFTKSISRAATSLLLNDNILEYSGEDHEILYTNLFMAMNYAALGMFDDVFVEVRRANEKLQLLEQKYARASDQLQRGQKADTTKVAVEYKADKVRFNNDAFARYLSMKVYSAEGKIDDARLDYDLMLHAFQTQPHIYDFQPPDVKIPDGKSTVLSVVGLAGLAPIKEAVNLRIRTDKDLDLVQILYTDGENKDTEYGHLPIPVSEDYYFKFAIPKLVPRPSAVSKVEVYADSKFVGQLGLIEDISRVAEETFKAKSSLIYLRSVARAVAKGLTAHKLKKKADTGGLEGWLKKAAVDVASDISENADLRCARYLPGKIFVGDIELEPGTYDITVKFKDSHGAEIESSFFPQYRVKNQAMNLIEAFSPR